MTDDYTIQGATDEIEYFGQYIYSTTNSTLSPFNSQNLSNTDRKRQEVVYTFKNHILSYP